MPLYEYHCQPCELTFEALIRTAGDQPSCPRCSSSDVIKQLSVPAMAHTSSGRAGALSVSPGPGGGSPSFGCGRPQCGSGVCAGLE
jgi:putative FmdB family regulatory protein